MQVWIQRGAGGPDLPSKITKKYSFFSNTGPDPLKIVKLPSQLSILGHNRHASETQFWALLGPPAKRLMIRRFADGPKRTR